ncbi:hypothetical protein EVAR_10085_1 [Eumeta japonica]|uniref:Uncharacterized protein n=1 Tax=Eumeta variegata TaxID=151549 RepID=A0A4C1TRB8_EUMVA|nr:hypothetical protein EVAR_10085_1 [Eumeta japonica]
MLMWLPRASGGEALALASTRSRFDYNSDADACTTVRLNRAARATTRRTLAQMRDCGSLGSVTPSRPSPSDRCRARAPRRTRVAPIHYTIQGDIAVRAKPLGWQTAPSTLSRRGALDHASYARHVQLDIAEAPVQTIILKGSLPYSTLKLRRPLRSESPAGPRTAFYVNATPNFAAKSTGGASVIPDGFAA